MMSAIEEASNYDTEALTNAFSEKGFSPLDITDTLPMKSSENDQPDDIDDDLDGFELSCESGDRTVEDEEGSQSLPNGLDNGLDLEDDLQEDTNPLSPETQQQNSQDISDSKPEGEEKEESLMHWSDADSSPGRLQIDSEDVPEAAKSPLQASDDDADPNALMIDTEDPGGDMEDSSKPKKQEIVDQDSSFYFQSTNVDDTIESVIASVSVSPVKSETKLTINLKRRNTVKNSRQSVSERSGPNVKKIVKKRQISSTLKCPRCPSSSFSTVTALVEHQQSCGFDTPPVVSTETPKVPRKVYMCSACGSYFELCTLFLHMKELHKRHICLYCLGMFSQASKLAQHLASRHHVWEKVYVSGDDLSAVNPGPHFLLCCRCDRMCTEKDFESHSCSSVCSHCGLAGTHYPTCRLAPPVTAKLPRNPRRRSKAPKKVKDPWTEPPPQLPSQVQHPTPPESPIVAQDIRSSADELSPTTFNERMMQLYRSNRLPERNNISSMDSIEETINRVVEESAATSGAEEDIVDENPEQVEQEVKRITPPVPEEPPKVVEEEEEDEEKVEGVDNNNEDYEEDEDEEEEVEDDRHNLVDEVAEEPEQAPEERSDEDSSDSQKLTIALEPGGVRKNESTAQEDPESGIVLAGEETPYSSVPLSEPLNVARVPTAMKLFVRSTSLTCVYCAHARKIAVNGKQLALHLLAQHRYITVAESSSDQDRSASHATVVRCIREALPTLESVYFNAYGYDSLDKSAWRSADRVYECFHCCFSTPDSKEFLVHNRKAHQNAGHLCIMCKTRFLSYSELLCHLCGGVYIPGRIIDPHLRYRCYACDIEPLPSSFQLMVHLRTVHTACDMCFALCDSQTALYAHVQKHKFIFYCYACALTYRTRQEITRHIFWKHGAESVTCKRCLQKKWRHAYHFCLPPLGFSCEECAGWFTTASALRVHKRLHQGLFPHSCQECSEKFISRKLLAKHAIKHEPPPVNGSSSPPSNADHKKPKKKKEVADLFDLPPVNLSESDDSSEDEKSTVPKEDMKKETLVTALESQTLLPTSEPLTETDQPSMDAVPGGMWDGVLASLEGERGRSYPPDSPFFNLPLHRVTAIMLADHDYCRPISTVGEGTQASADHDYCDNGINLKNDKRTQRTPKKRRNRSSSSDSSSSSSSSCTCGSNCSCSSSSSSTESASSGDRKVSKRKGSKQDPKNEKITVDEDMTDKADVEVEPSIDVVDGKILESDLETDEPITDDDEFYEKNPALRASEVLQRNRSLLLDKLEGSPNQSHTLGTSSKKSKRKRSSPVHGEARSPRTPRSVDTGSLSFYESDTSTTTPDGRRPQRKRVPLKFYGFSSGDDDEAAPSPPPKKKERIVEHNTTIPAPPPQVAPSSPELSNLWNPPSWRPPPVAPKVNPIKIRTGSLKQTFAKSVDSGEFTITRADLGGFHVNGASGDVNRGEKLYCFCQCPYDEVSEMIACDAVDCRIEWFHFECVGIMVPPKGKWFCPDCKKKAAAESELMGLPLRPA